MYEARSVAPSIGPQKAPLCVFTCVYKALLKHTLGSLRGLCAQRLFKYVHKDYKDKSPVHFSKDPYIHIGSLRGLCTQRC